MSGARIRLARLSNGLSLQELADILSDTGTPITRAGLSKYENDQVVPNENTLSQIARILDLDIDFFRKDDLPGFTFRYAREYDAGNKAAAWFEAYLQISFEQFFEIETLLGKLHKGTPFVPLHITGDDKEALDDLSIKIRESWQAPCQPISSVIGLLEDNGIFVFAIPESFGIPYLSGVELGSGIPFIGYAPVHDSVDILRMRLLQALGSIVIEADDPSLSDHLYRVFARAFLLPKKMLLSELGSDYRNPTYWELTLLKLKYGISKVEIRNRLRDLKLLRDYPENVIGDIKTYRSLRRRLDSAQDPLMFSESPVRFRMDVLLAYKYGLITKSRAASLLPKRYVQMASWDD